MLKKISTKIILSYTALIVLLVITLMFLFNGLARDAQIDVIKREMNEKLRFIELALSENRVSMQNTAGLSRKAVEISKIISLRITIVDLSGKVIADSKISDLSGMENHIYRPEISSALEKGHGESIRYSNTLKHDLLYSALKSDRFIIRLSKSLKEIDANISRLQAQIFLYGAMIIIISVFTAIFLSRKITRPIDETLSFARHFSTGDYSRRILNYSDDEVGTVQRALNRMADTIVEKINSLIFEQNKLKITLESISDGIAVVANDKKILTANMTFMKFIGMESPIQGRFYFEAIRSRTINEKIESALSGGLSVAFGEDMLNGRRCSVHINPILAEINLQGILIVLYDITEKRKIEQIKTDLVANMSHELKTPVAIMKGYLETIGETLHDTDSCRSFLQKAVENADRQNAIINDILKLNMIESTSGFPIEEIRINDIINNCVDILTPKAALKKISISLDLAGVDFPVRGNPFIAEEIFFNIIDNGINYNIPHGKLNISSEAADGRLTVCVADTGIGIPPEHIDRIFERFYRVDKGRSRATGGTGLGLSIVKHACELLDWKIRVTSTSGGTVFKILT